MLTTVARIHEAARELLPVRLINHKREKDALLPRTGFTSPPPCPPSLLLSTFPLSPRPPPSPLRIDPDCSSLPLPTPGQMTFHDLCKAT